MYTSTTIANGRGLSLVASPEEEKLIANAEVFRLTEGGRENIDYAGGRTKRDNVSGKGIGIIATKPIERGTVVVYTTTPLAAIQQTAMQRLDTFKADLLQQIAVERLPSASRDLFFSQSQRPFNRNPYGDRIQTNAFTSSIGGDSDELYLTVFPEAAQLNHDCRPNVGFNITPDTLEHTMYALRTIHPGEEVTDSYLLPYLTWDERQARTRQQWGFNCSCELCGASADEIKVSDRNIHHIIELERRLASLSVTNPRTAVGPAHAEELVRLYQDERLYGAIAEAYAFAALEYAYQANRQMTRKYAVLAVEALTLLRGDWNSAVRTFESMVEDPEQNQAWDFAAAVKEFVEENGSMDDGPNINQQFGSIIMGWPTEGDLRKRGR